MQEIMERILVDFGKNSGVIASAIMDSDGLIIASHAPDMPMEEQEATGGLMTQLLNTAMDISSTADYGEVHNVMSEAEGGKMFIMNAGEVYFGFLTQPDINLGYIRVQAKKTLEKIKGSI